ncbi:MAG: YidC/Oxa1 family membrane protein insertase [Oscillospiraceae bacterium]|jgi:YidC/Oxa1 family membrane protein insertase|nr:YidC/Oxa1 family membrane protein insertase [Oscillospiraceae bacterium]
MFDAIAVPFGMLLMWLYEFCKNYGLAVIFFAIIVNLILLPFQMKAKRGTMRQARIQPKIKELEKKHGANRQKYQQEVANLYKEEGVSMTGGCLWSLLPLPIMLALYRAISLPLTTMMRVEQSLLAENGAITAKLAELGFEGGAGYYQQIAQTHFIYENFGSFEGISPALRQINYSFLGIDLGATPQWKVWEFDWSSPERWLPMLLLFLVPVVTAGLQLVQTIISQKISPAPQMAEGQAASSTNMMLMMMPVMMLVFAFAAPAALGVYWSAGAVLNILRDIWLTKRYNRIMDQEDEVRLAANAKKKAELERKRQETERLKAENKTAVNPSTSKKKLELSEKKEREAKSAEWEKKHKPDKPTDEEPSREGTRRYARGRAYTPDRYDGSDGETDIIDEARQEPDVGGEWDDTETYDDDEKDDEGEYEDSDE